MADCNIILECCTGQTNCNKKITIGYLKSFIMSGSTYLIKTVGGADVHVNTLMGDDYEPTYSELTNGSILPTYIDGGVNSGASSVDGILINGNYSQNETVEQTDLSLVYTRFKSLQISAERTLFDNCGDNTNMSYIYTLEKTVKEISVCDPLTYSYASTDVIDTTNVTPNNVTFNAGCNWITVNGSSITADKNEDGATRYCTISAVLAYKGNTETSDNTVTIEQPSVGGNWAFSARTYDSLSIQTYDVLNYDCDGGSFSISGTGQYTDHYYWKNACDDVDTGNTSAVTATESAGSVSDSFPSCPDAHTQTKTLSLTYHGITSSVTFTQTCDDCGSCVSYNVYGSCTYNGSVDECGGNVTVSCSMPITTHTKTWIDGVCVDTTGTTAETQTATVNIPQNSTQAATSYTGSVSTQEGGTINYTIAQDAGPCGGCTGAITTYVYENVTVSIDDCDTSVSVNIPYTKIVSYDNCASEITYGTATTSYTVSKNETSQPVTYTETYYGQGGESSTITINQEAGPCTCLCDMLVVSPTTFTWTYDKSGSTNSQRIVISKADCITNVTINSSSLIHFNVDNESKGNYSVYPIGANNTNSAYVETFTITYSAGETQCTSSVTLTQTAQEDPCLSATCGELTVSGASSNFNESGETKVLLASISATPCVSNVTATSNSAWLTITSVNTVSGVILGTMTAQECETNTRVANVTVSYVVNGVNCSETFPISQNGNSELCPCTDFEYKFGFSGNGITNEDTLTVSACSTGPATIYPISNKRCISPVGEYETAVTYHNITSLNGNNNYFTLTELLSIITVSWGLKNSGATITEQYRFDFYEDSGKTIYLGSKVLTIIQEGGCNPCSGKTCSELTITNDINGCLPYTMQNEVRVATITASSCVSNISVSTPSDYAWIQSPYIKNDALRISLDERSCGTSQRSGYTVVSWEVDGQSCSGKVDVCQDGNPTPCTAACNCNMFSASSYNITFDSDGYMISPSTGLTWTTTASCEGSYFLHPSSSAITSCSINPNGTITITTIENTSYTNSITASISINTGDSASARECSTRFTVTILPRTCNCSALSAPVEVTTSIPQSGASHAVIWRGLMDSCLHHVEALEVYCDPIFTSIGTGTSGSYYVVSANVSSNTAEEDKTCVIGYHLFRNNNGSSESCNLAYTTVTVAGTGACDCVAAQAVLGNHSYATIPTSGVTGAYIPYTANCGTITASVDNASWAAIDYVDTVNHRIVYNVSANTGNARSQYLNLLVNGVMCTRRTFNQAAFVCDCETSNFYVDTTPIYVNSNSATSTINCSTDCLAVGAISNVNWITVTGNYGSYVRIAIDENTSPVSTRTGTVKLYLAGFSDSCYSSVTVVQSEAECSCHNSNIEVTPVQSLPYSGGTHIKIATFTATCTDGLKFSSVGNSLTNITFDSNGNIYADVPVNTSFSSTKSYTLTWSIKGGAACNSTAITQSVKPCNCSTSNFSVSPTLLSFSSGYSASQRVNFTADCGTVSATTSNSWISGITVYNVSKYLYIGVEPNTGSPRTGTVKVYLVGYESSCYYNITVTQERGNTGGTPCDCTGFTVTGVSGCISNAMQTGATIGYFTGGCQSILSIVASQNWLRSFRVSGNAFIAYVEANCGAARTATVTVNVSANGTTCSSKTFTVTQCKGGVAYITPNYSSGGCASETVQFTATPN